MSQSPKSCLECSHHKEHYTHLTGCVKCTFPGQEDPRVTKNQIIRMGAWVVPNNSAHHCNNFEEKSSNPKSSSSSG